MIEFFSLFGYTEKKRGNGIMALTNLQQPLSQNELDFVIRHHFGKENYTALLLEGGMFNTTYRITFGSESRCILRVCPPDKSILLPFERHLIDGEALFYRICKRHSIPAPEVLAYGTDGCIIARDYIFLCFLDGESISAKERAPEEKARLRERAGALTFRLHSIGNDCFGRISAIARGERYASWSGALLSEFDAWSDCALANRLFTEREVNKLRSVFIGYSPILDEITAPQFAHGDLWDGNVLVSNGDGQSLSFIDGDHAIFGDANFDFASGWMIDEAFLRGYGNPPPESGNDLLRKQVYRLLFALNDAFAWPVEYLDVQTGSQRKADALKLAGSLLKNL